jgi:hypothetical protein
MQGGRRGRLAFGVWRSAKGVPVERCLACEADAVGNRPFVPKGRDEVCAEPIAWRGAALARRMKPLQLSPQRGCRQNTT